MSGEVEPRTASFNHCLVHVRSGLDKVATQGSRQCAPDHFIFHSVGPHHIDLCLGKASQCLLFWTDYVKLISHLVVAFLL